jgi:tetratricopeptide (TPR) repeat protein
MRLKLLRCVVLLPAAPMVHAAGTAVLSFANVSAGTVPNAANYDWIGESIAETLREALGARGVLTATRDEVQDAYRELSIRPLAELSWGSVLKAGQELAADTLLYGTFAFVPRTASGPPDSLGTLSIRARIAVPRALHQSEWIVETGPLEELGTLETHLAWRALTLIDPARAPGESDFRELRAPVRLDAEENYIRGLLAPHDQKEKYFLQAARLDIRFWRPGFQLGKLLLERKEYREAAAWLERVDPRDMHYREANFYRGLALFAAGDYKAAAEAFAMIAQTVGAAEVYNNLGAAESRLGNAHSLDSFGRAVDANPSEPDYHFNLGYALFKTGQFDAAADRFRAVLDRDPADTQATLLLGRCLQRQGLRKGNAGDARLENLERVKDTYQERAFFQDREPRDP